MDIKSIQCGIRGILVTLAMGLGKLQAQDGAPTHFSFARPVVWGWILLGLFIVVLMVALVLQQRVRAIKKVSGKKTEPLKPESLRNQINRFNPVQLDQLIHLKRKGGLGKSRLSSLLIPGFLLLASTWFPGGLAWGQGEPLASKGTLFNEAGILITIGLIAIPIVVAILLLYVKSKYVLGQFRNKQRRAEATQLAQYLKDMPEEEVETVLVKRKKALDFSLSNTELSGIEPPEDKKGILQINAQTGLPVVAPKKRAQKRPDVDPGLSKLVCWYLACACFWLLFGTTVGEYVGIKFIAPDADHVSWLSFGRLRPVHTNSVFWGWASLAMLGLGYYVVPRVSNTPLFSLRQGWWALWLINISVVLGTICLMAGINNGGGEYREYIWPVMLLFALALVLTLRNFYLTIARRKTREIYIANWYIVSSIIFAITIVVVAYVPSWQHGLGETIIQGYYMHQGVGMWFMLFTLGIVYYFLPQQLNKPIYSYSLGILAFWTQILFYTLIGSHHFVFSAIPWWLQTVAIVGSAGMAIPVIAGTTNFLLTFKGAWHKLHSSYTLPFFLVGIIFYFTGSLQGTAEAFRTTNLIWHFTDFTVAHSHMTMYGIICFFLWAGIYAIVPRLTGKEPPQIMVGMHFWLALIGLLFYIIPLMYGSTLRGVSWLNGIPFIQTVVDMAPYWVWRAVGGSLMWISHLVFAYNMYIMYSKRNEPVNIQETALAQLRDKVTTA